MFYLRSNYKADEYHLPVVRRLLHKLCLQRMFLVYHLKKQTLSSQYIGMDRRVSICFSTSTFFRYVGVKVHSSLTSAIYFIHFTFVMSIVRDFLPLLIV